MDGMTVEMDGINGVVLEQSGAMDNEQNHILGTGRGKHEKQYPCFDRLSDG